MKLRTENSWHWKANAFCPCRVSLKIYGRQQEKASIFSIVNYDVTSCMKRMIERFANISLLRFKAMQTFNHFYRVSTTVRRISVCVWVRTRSFIKSFIAVRIIKSERQFVQPLLDFRRNSIVTIYFCSDVLIFVTIRFLTDFWVRIESVPMRM